MKTKILDEIIVDIL